MRKLLLINFLRSKAYALGLGILLLSGLMSLEIGKRFLEKTARISQKTESYQQESIHRNVAYFNQELGTLMYYLKFGLENQTPNLAGLSIGQRDIYPSIQSVTIRNLEEQRYATDLTNPMYQLLGNMDFSFVLIYFFPLVIISFGFNLISEEKEGGTWSLIRSQTGSPARLLRLKMGIRMGSVILILLILLIAGKIYLAIPFDAAFFAFSLISLLYVLFWCSLTWLVASFDKSSSQNAQILLICWVILNLILPAGINAIQRIMYPVPEAMSAVIQNREGYHSQWDKAKEPTMEHFYQRYPQFAVYSLPEEKDFSWLWYFAMQQLGDDQAADQVIALKQKLRSRAQFANWAGWMVPSVHSQLSLNSIAVSDIENYLNYLTALEGFHEELKLYFFPRVFSEAPVAAENWDEFVVQTFSDQLNIPWLRILLPFIISIAALIIWANSNLKKAKLS